MKIVIDAMGGDNAPKAIVDGVLLALKKFDDVEIILTGKKEQIEACLNGQNPERLEIVDAREVIENSDVPTVAIKEKTDSSLVVAFEILKSGNADAMISAGSTGAILTGGFLKIGRISGISRPALSPVLPTKKGKGVILIDCGANVDAKPINLLHFAYMGSCYMQAMYGIEKPKIALLNIGTEEEKGNELTKETFELLKNAKNINFVGNVEGRDIIEGDVDVVVSDGFSGNVALKSIEGAVSLVSKEIKSLFKGFFGKIAGLLTYKKLKNIKAKLDYNKYGGSPFIGCKKIIIKSHGSSKAETILACVNQAIYLHQNKLIDKIKNSLVIEE